jgi:hypothetical protein
VISLDNINIIIIYSKAEMLIERDMHFTFKGRNKAKKKIEELG